jgi:hypothetical protein
MGPGLRREGQNGSVFRIAPPILICHTLLRGNETMAAVKEISHVRRLVFVALSTIKIA